MPSLKPSDARLGIIDLSVKLKRYIDSTLNEDQSFVLIGFSMGCIVSRYYLQNLEGVNRCQAFHGISGPYHGSLLAYFFIGQGARDLRPDSPLLNDLKNNEKVLKNIELHSYRTPFDQMILPSKSSHWLMANNHVAPALMHRFMLGHPVVLRGIRNTVERLRESG